MAFRSQGLTLSYPLFLTFSPALPIIAACQCSMYHYYGDCPHTDKQWVNSDPTSGEEKAADPHWSTNALQHQAEIEGKVGRSYYKP